MYYLKKGGFFCKGINFDSFSNLQLSSNFLIKYEIQNLRNYIFSDNRKIYYNKRFYDVHNLNITQANLLFHKNWKVWKKASLIRFPFEAY